MMKKEIYYKKIDNGEIHNIRKINVVDKILLPIGFTLMILFLFIQGIAFSPIRKDIFSTSSSYDGKPVTEKECLYKTGNIILKIENAKEFKKVKIYINGEYYLTFINNEMHIPLKENDIIEVDSVDASGKSIITITGISGVVPTQYLDKIFEINEEKKTIYG